MDAFTHEVRLNQWKLIIEQCQSRPDGQTARQWMAENGVQEKTYYYWLRRVRKEGKRQMLGWLAFRRQIPHNDR